MQRRRLRSSTQAATPTADQPQQPHTAEQAATHTAGNATEGPQPMQIDGDEQQEASGPAVHVRIQPPPASVRPAENPSRKRKAAVVSPTPALTPLMPVTASGSDEDDGDEEADEAADSASAVRRRTSASSRGQSKNSRRRAAGNKRHKATTEMPQENEDAEEATVPPPLSILPPPRRVSPSDVLLCDEELSDSPSPPSAEIPTTENVPTTVTIPTTTASSDSHAFLSPTDVPFTCTPDLSAGVLMLTPPECSPEPPAEHVCSLQCEHNTAHHAATAASAAAAVPAVPARRSYSKSAASASIASLGSSNRLHPARSKQHGASSVASGMSELQHPQSSGTAGSAVIEEEDEDEEEEDMDQEDVNQMLADAAAEEERSVLSYARRVRKRQRAAAAAAASIIDEEEDDSSSREGGGGRAVYSLDESEYHTPELHVASRHGGYEWSDTDPEDEKSDTNSSSDAEEEEEEEDVSGLDESPAVTAASDEPDEDDEDEEDDESYHGSDSDDEAEEENEEAADVEDVSASAASSSASDSGSAESSSSASSSSDGSSPMASSASDAVSSCKKPTAATKATHSRKPALETVVEKAPSGKGAAAAPAAAASAARVKRVPARTGSNVSARSGTTSVSMAVPLAPKKKKNPFASAPGLSPFPLVPPVQISRSPRHEITPYPSFDDLTTFRRSQSLGGDLGSPASAAAAAAASSSSPTAAAAAAAASATPAVDPYTCLNPSLSLDELFARASSIPYNFSTVHSTSKGWSFQGEWDLYKALVNRSRRVQEQHRDRVAAAAATATAAASASSRRSHSPAAAGEMDLICSDVYDQSLSDLNRDLAATIRTPSEHASLNIAALARGEPPLPPLASNTPFDCFFKHEWGGSVPEELQRVHALYEKTGMERGLVTPLAQVDLETPGGLAFRAVKYARSESQQIGRRLPSQAALDQRKVDVLTRANSLLSPSASGASAASFKPLPPLLRLPADWVAQILSYLDLPTLLGISQCCRALRQVLHAPNHRSTVWRNQLVLLKSLSQITGWRKKQPGFSSSLFGGAEEENSSDLSATQPLNDEDDEEHEQENLSPPPFVGSAAAAAAAAASVPQRRQLLAPRSASKPKATSMHRDRLGRAHSSLSSMHAANEQYDEEELAAAEQQDVLAPGEEFFLASAERKASWTWERVHEGISPASIPSVHMVRFEEEVVWCPSMYLRVLHPFAATLHTLHICGSLTLVNDLILPAMLLGLEPSEEIFAEMADAQFGMHDGTIDATKSAARALLASHLRVQDEMRAAAQEGSAAAVASASSSWLTAPAAASSAASSRSVKRTPLYNTFWCLTPETRVALPALTSLTLFNTINFDLDGGLAFLPFYQAQLKVLHLAKCRGVGGGALPVWLQEAGAEAAAEAQRLSTPFHAVRPQPVHLSLAPHNPLGSCTMLQSLRLAGCRELAPVHVALLRPLGQLQMLDLSFCVLVDDAALQQLLQGNHALARSLRALYLQGCSAITDRALLESVPQLRALETLDLSQVPSITNAGLAQLPALPQLQRLLLRFCPLLSDSVSANVVRMRALRFIDVNSCPLITVHGKIAMKNRKQGAPLAFLTV